MPQMSYALRATWSPEERENGCCAVGELRSAVAVAVPSLVSAYGHRNLPKNENLRLKAQFWSADHRHRNVGAGCGTRNAELGKSLCLLVKVEVLRGAKMVWPGPRIPDCDGRKKGHLGHYKKSFFRPLKKCCFFALFEIVQKRAFQINEYRPVVKFRIFRFCSKTGQKQAQKKYRVKPTVGYRFGNVSDRM